MGSIKQTEKEFDLESYSFDELSFMRNIFQRIDTTRSDFTSRPGEVFVKMEGKAGREHSESRINTFYRMIGLPAIRSTEFLNNKNIALFDLKNPLSQWQTLNYVDSNIFPEKDEVLQELAVRESDLQKKLNSAFYTADQMNKMVQEPLALDSAVFGVSERRNSVFPLFVNADIPIFPLKKRVAPLFYNKDYIISASDGVRLPRPFLESVIYMRTKVFGNSFPSDFELDLITTTEQFVTKFYTQFDNALLNTEEQINSLINGSRTLIETKLKLALIQGLRSAAVNYASVIKNVKSVSSKAFFIPQATETPQEGSNNNLENSQPNLAIEGSLDKLIRDLELKVLEKASLINLFPTNEITKLDAKYREEQGLVLKNIMNDAFSSDFNSILLSDLEIDRQRLSEKTGERDRVFQQVNQLKELIQYYSGEGVGLSVFDVLCVFLALFKVDLGIVVGLLNAPAKERLAKNRFYAVTGSELNNSETSVLSQDLLNAAFDQNINIIDAVVTLEEAVLENYQLAKGFFISAETKDSKDI